MLLQLTSVLLSAYSTTSRSLVKDVASDYTRMVRHYGLKCTNHVVVDTKEFQTGPKKERWSNRTLESITLDYFNSYKSEQQGQQFQSYSQNMLNLGQFLSLADIHLIRRFGEAVALSYWYKWR